MVHRKLQSSLNCWIFRIVSARIMDLTKIFSRKSKAANTSSGDRKISVHPLSQNPTQAWSKLKPKQIVREVDPLDPDAPITDDKIRFVCLSDTHSTVEKLTNFVPPGDVLLHAGDFTQLGFPKAVKEFNDFLGTLPHKVKIVIAGNHDLTLDMDMVNNQRGDLAMRFNIQTGVFEDYLETAQVKSTRHLLTNCIYLLDSGIQVSGIKIFGCPWQPEFGGWAFNLKRGAPCLEKWNNIPDDTDILLTHGPPIGHGDLCSSGLRAGCVELLSSIQNRIRPKYHLFGHIHEGYGVTTDGYTTFINGSNCTLRYKPDNKPVVFDFPVPEGHSKEELCVLPVNNLDSAQSS